MLEKEREAKEKRVQGYLREKGADFALLGGRPGLAWMTCGAFDPGGFYSKPLGCWLLLGAAGERILFCDPQGICRFDPDLLSRLGYELRELGWIEGGAPAEEIQKFTGSGRVLSDRPMEAFDPLGPAFRLLRNPLLPDEVERYKSLGYEASEALLEAARSVGPGYKEFEIEALIAGSCLRRRLHPSLIQVAVDDRIDRRRAPVPGDASFQDRVLMVLCAERQGLHAGLTRFLYRSAIPRGLDRRHEAAARIEARAISKSRPGSKLGEVVQAMIEAYQEVGHGEEWKRHPLGGARGYEVWDCPAVPGSDEPITAGQVLAWTPTLPGTRSEDTILVTEKGIEILTRGQGWDQLPISLGPQGGTLERPWPLVI